MSIIAIMFEAWEIVIVETTVQNSSLPQNTHTGAALNGKFERRGKKMRSLEAKEERGPRLVFPSFFKQQHLP